MIVVKECTKPFHNTWLFRMNLLKHLYDSFWHESHWWPPGFNWTTLQSTASERYPQAEELRAPIGYACILLVLRCLFERSCQYFRQVFCLCCIVHNQTGPSRNLSDGGLGWNQVNTIRQICSSSSCTCSHPLRKRFRLWSTPNCRLFTRSGRIWTNFPSVCERRDVFLEFPLFHQENIFSFRMTVYLCLFIYGLCTLLDVSFKFS